MSTKALADALGIIRRRLVPQPSTLSTNVITTASSVATQSRRRKRSKKSVAASAVATAPSLQDARSIPSVSDIGLPSVQPVADPVTSAPPNGRQNGQCTQCLRVLSLTSSGLLHAHGHGCLGSSQLPVAGSVSAVACSKRDAQSSAVGMQ